MHKTVLFFVGLSFLGFSTIAAAEAVQFNRDIRPILSDNCFFCHGPDSAHRKAGLRLDTEKGVFGKSDNGIPVVPKKPGASEIVSRIFSNDADEQMPPPESHKKLTADQKALIKQWIEQGAVWQPHWSLVVPERAGLPDVKKKEWVKTPIDAFVLAKLEEKGLAPAPEADRRTLARRVSFDLTGLPPTPAEVDSFVQDTSPAAYEEYVDRLMAKPQWGEHRGRYWLDAARYGDTHGIHNDNYREMWPYRDWVITAFNANMPFDRFTVEQIAGDLLPNRTLNQQIASGFHRCNITTSEGGSISDEVLAVYAKDRADTTGTVFLGLTIGCATCHDHKFDPITTRDFYSMTAFFRNTTQGAMDGNQPDTPPIIVVPGDADRSRWERLSADKSAADDDRRRERDYATKHLDEWLAGGHQRITTPPVGNGWKLDVEEPGAERVGAKADDAPVTDFAWNRGTLDLALPMGVTAGEGPPDGPRALHFAAKSAIDFPHVNTATDTAFSVGGWVFVPPAEGSFAVATGIAEKGVEPAWSLSIETRVPTFRVFGKNGEKIEVRGNSSTRPASGKWVHLFVTYDGSRHPSGVTLYINGKPEFPDYAAASKPLDGPAGQAAIVRLGGDGKRDFAGGAIANFRLYDAEVLADEVKLLSRWGSIQKLVFADPQPAKLTPQQRDDLVLLQLMSSHSGRYRLASDLLARVEAEQRQIRKRSVTTLVMAEKPGEPMARVLFRGQYDQPKDEVKAATPAALHPFPAGAPHNRLGLSQWLVDPANPLTARVTVNRFWQELFGTGLVRTSEDFGIMGENPTHPELLDWLAVEFRESGWDVKKFFKLMVMSSAYRQQALASADKLRVDPQNRFLSRGPRFRMDAEMLRDFALSSSGLLANKIGGPSVKPYQPPGVWEAVAMFGSNTRFYKQESGENLYRRSMYWFWKRSAPPAPMDLFNAPSREVCTVRRERTNTPLQALVTMNDPQWVEAARRLAERAMTEGGDNFESRLDFVTLRLLSRPMEARERQICQASLNDFVASYTNNVEAAKKFIATGESKVNEKLPTGELAGWTMLVSELMNLDEALNK